MRWTLSPEPQRGSAFPVGDGALEDMGVLVAVKGDVGADAVGLPRDRLDGDPDVLQRPDQMVREMSQHPAAIPELVNLACDTDLVPSCAILNRPLAKRG